MITEREAVSGSLATIKRIRGGRGLGDALYVRPIVDALVALGGRIRVLTDYRDVFIGSGAQAVPFERVRVDVTAHYVGGKRNPYTTQWQDVCASAGINTPLRFQWPIKNRSLISRLRAKAGRKAIVLIHGGRIPMGRADGFGIELLPRPESFTAVLEELRDCFTVQIGKAAQVYPLHTNVNLNGDTSISDLLDLGANCDGVVAQCSFAVPLAEVFEKPLLVVWGSAVSRSKEQFVHSITPHKVLSAERDRFVVDDLGDSLIREAAIKWRVEQIVCDL